MPALEPEALGCAAVGRVALAVGGIDTAAGEATAAVGVAGAGGARVALPKIAFFNVPKMLMVGLLAPLAGRVSTFRPLDIRRVYGFEIRRRYAGIQRVEVRPWAILRL